MKKIIIVLAFIASGITQQALSQDSTKTTPSALLSSYFEIKNALVSGNGNSASLKAYEYAKLFKTLPSGNIPEEDRTNLIQEAFQIAAVKDIRQQRDHFANLSLAMYALAKKVKLSSQPIYYANCSMKKAYWLSNAPLIKNPYFGNAMLTCGKVEEIL